MVDRLSGAQSAQNLKQSHKAEADKPSRSFEEVAKERAGKARKKEDKKAEKKGDEEDGARAAAGSEYAQRLAEQLGISEGDAKALPGKAGDAGEGGLDADGGGGKGIPVSESGVEEAMLGMVKGDSGKGGESFKGALENRNAGDAEITSQTAKEDMVSVDGERTQFKAEVEDQRDQDQDFDLESELSQNLFASGIGNPLMAQRASEPQPVAPVQAVPQLPAAVVDKVVERARFGATADGGHEFQIDLKQDVFGGAELRVLTKDGKVTVQMVSDDTNLHHAAKQLSAQLKAKGVNVDQVEVLTKGEAETRLAEERASAGGAARKRSANPWSDDDEIR